MHCRSVLHSQANIELGIVCLIQNLDYVHHSKYHGNELKGCSTNAKAIYFTNNKRKTEAWL